jgi:ectoine hydroxylase-related dioxygenase (phytanoyl-CoA dioxygenase family)
VSVLSTVKAVNRQLGNPLRALRGARELVEPRLRMRTFERDRASRAQRYAAADFGFVPQREVAEQIERDGYAVLRQVVDPTLLHEVYAAVEAHLNAGTALQRIAKDSARAKGDIREAQVHLTAEEAARGQAYLRQHTNYVAIANPLITVPAVNELAFHPLLLDIAQTYLDCVPALGGMNLRKSFRNELAEFDTLYFHVDPNSPKFLKFFFYLNDVDPSGGPFCYVRHSHRRRFRGWMKKGRWTPEEIEAYYGASEILYLTANVGDLIVADTNGFHRGTKITGSDRTMLTLDFVVHPEFDGTQDRSLYQIARQRLQLLTPRQRAAADFLQVVG